jgi:glutathione synthase
MDKYLFILDPLALLNVKTDTSLALMQEACARNKAAYACEISDIFLNQGELCFNTAPVELSPNYSSPPEYLAPKQVIKAHEFKIIFMRKDPPINEYFWSALLCLRSVDKKQTLVVNNPDGLLIANEKLFGLSIAPQFFPPTLVSSDAGVIKNFIKRHPKIVLKPLFGAGGSGVLVFESGDLNLNAALELVSKNYTRQCIIQAYIKNARSGDKRILLLGGDPLGAVLRMPHAHDHRANFHAGGTAQDCEISERDYEIIAHLKPHLLSLGLYFVGIDIIDGYLTEINVTSPTCLLEMEQLTGRQLRKQALDYIENLI